MVEKITILEKSTFFYYVYDECFTYLTSCTSRFQPPSEHVSWYQGIKIPPHQVVASQNNCIFFLPPTSPSLILMSDFQRFLSPQFAWSVSVSVDDVDAATAAAVWKFFRGWIRLIFLLLCYHYLLPYLAGGYFSVLTFLPRFFPPSSFVSCLCMLLDFLVHVFFFCDATKMFLFCIGTTTPSIIWDCSISGGGNILWGENLACWTRWQQDWFNWIFVISTKLNSSSKLPELVSKFISLINGQMSILGYYLEF